MDQSIVIILIILGVIGIVIVNLLNMNRPVFRLGGTVIVTLGCALSLLFYYHIYSFKDATTIAITVVLTVALLLLAYLLVVLGGSYRKGREDVRKKNISKRPKFTAPPKKEKAARAGSRGSATAARSRVSLEEDDADEAPAAHGEDAGSRKPGRRRLEEEPLSGLTVEDYLNEIAADQNGAAEPAGEGEMVAQGKAGYPRGEYEDIGDIDPDEAEEWTPDTVSEDERREYLRSQYAWMEKNKAEDELSPSLIFGGAEEAEPAEPAYAQEPDIQEPVFEAAPVFEPMEIEAEEPAYRKDADELEMERELEMEEPELFGMSGGEEEESVWDIVPEEEAGPEVAAYGEEPAPVPDEYTEEPAEEAPAVYEEEPVATVFAQDEMEEEPVFAEEMYMEEEALSEPEVADYEEELVSVLDEYIEAPEEAPADVEEEPEEPVYAEESYIGEPAAEEISFVEEYEEPVFAGEAYAEEPEEEAFAEEEMEEPAFVAEEYTEETAAEEPAAMAEPEPLTPAEEKRMAIDELKQLVVRKRYDDALKKVFEILNRGYVMTPDEKQQMKVVMMTLKSKT